MLFHDSSAQAETEARSLPCDGRIDRKLAERLEHPFNLTR